MVYGIYMNTKLIHWRYTPRRAWCGTDVGDDTANVATDDKDRVTCARCKRSIYAASRPVPNR